MGDKRLHTRTPAALTLFDSYSGVYQSVITRDISGGGAYLVVEQRPGVGETMRVAIAQMVEGAGRARQLLEAEAVVKWVGDDGVGVEFVEPSSAFMIALTKLYCRT